jgi:hypothetical protein
VAKKLVLCIFLVASCLAVVQFTHWSKPAPSGEGSSHGPAGLDVESSLDRLDRLESRTSERLSRESMSPDDNTAGSTRTRVVVGAVGQFMADPLKSPTIVGEVRSYGGAFNHTMPLSIRSLDLNGKKTRFGGDWNPDFAAVEAGYVGEIVMYGQQSLPSKDDFPSMGVIGYPEKSDYGSFDEDKLPPM